MVQQKSIANKLDTAAWCHYDQAQGSSLATWAAERHSEVAAQLLFLLAGACSWTFRAP